MSKKKFSKAIKTLKHSDDLKSIKKAHLTIASEFELEDKKTQAITLRRQNKNLPYIVGLSLILSCGIFLLGKYLFPHNEWKGGIVVVPILTLVLSFKIWFFKIASTLKVESDTLVRIAVGGIIFILIISSSVLFFIGKL